MPFLSRNLDSCGETRSRGGSTAESVGGRRRNSSGWPRRLVPLIATSAALLLLVMSVSIGWIVRGAMRELTSESLRSILSANVTSLEMWLLEIRLDVSRLAEKEDVHDAAYRLLTSRSEDPTVAPASVKENASYQTLKRGMQNTNSYIGWALLDKEGLVVAASLEDLHGQALPIHSDTKDRLQRARATVCRPLKSPAPLLQEGPLSQSGAAVMCALAPITQGARTIGSLALLIDPMDRFTELLSVARTGRTGETYAFDRSGTLLSQSRFEHHLRAAALLDSNPLVASPLNVQIRDPGVNLVTGGTPSVPRDKQPLTLMADQATRGATGENVIGYNDYRGVPVVGAWRWLPEYGFGVTTEMDVAEAYRPFRLLQRALLSLVALIFLVGAGLLVAANSFRTIGDRSQAANLDARRLGQYQLGEVVGRGGMGVVYRGTHQLLRRDVAIKVLEDESQTSQSVIRFEREVQMTARLRHPNTIDIYDYGHTEDGTFFYVMEFVDGITLQELVHVYGPQSAGRTIHILLQICGSVSEAHQLGMIHRDIKPSNILITAQTGLFDRIKLLDFGLVKELDRDTVELTRTDAITGTPMYMSPESVRDAANADHQSDLYSVGAVGYTLMTGLPPFEGESSVDICWKQLNQDPVRPCERIGRPLPEDLQNVLMSCLRKDPNDRPMSIADLQDALRQCADANAWSTADAVDWWETEFRGFEDEEADTKSGDTKHRDNGASAAGSTEAGLKQDDPAAQHADRPVLGRKD